jgi:hypothetical protein
LHELPSPIEDYRNQQQEFDNFHCNVEAMKIGRRRRFSDYNQADRKFRSGSIQAVSIITSRLAAMASQPNGRYNTLCSGCLPKNDRYPFSKKP